MLSKVTVLLQIYFHEQFIEHNSTLFAIKWKRMREETVLLSCKFLMNKTIILRMARSVMVSGVRKLGPSE